LQFKLIKIGARDVRHVRASTFQLADVAVAGPIVHAILAVIRRLQPPLLSASPQSALKLNDKAGPVCMLS